MGRGRIGEQGDRIIIIIIIIKRCSGINPIPSTVKDREENETKENA